MANPNLLDSVRLSNGELTPRSFYTGYPDFNSFDATTQRFGYTLNHELNDNWRIRNNVAVSAGLFDDERATPGGVIDDSSLTGFTAFDLEYAKDNYFGQIDLLGKFKTGSISHQLLVGFDFNRFVEDYRGLIATNLPDLDISNPNYNVAQPDFNPFLEFYNPTETYGIYLQDQVEFSKNFKLLLGCRYDWISSQFEITDFGSLGNTTDEPVRTNGAFSPRLGLVYQPSDTVSLYASYSRSFRQDTGFNSSTQAFEPTRGTQYEVGVKADWLEGKLSTTLAAYHLTKSNVVTSDPNNSVFSIQTGEQRSQGIEL
ncbi:MAG: TonB-dependent receptor, partial [Rivularia sp. ALOHA_DT_140]|nr:TonB-dependent receptor [Rivularia sp. ALOHA_DT_140]